MNHPVERTLLDLENWFARLNTKISNHFVVTAQFDGVVELERWDAAVKAIIARHPMLRMRLKDDGSIFCLQEDGESAIEFTDEITDDRCRWRQCVQELMGARLGIDGGPLLLLHVIQGKDWCDVVLAVHHAIADGTGAAFLIRDLLQALDGGQLLQYPMPESIATVRNRVLGSLPIPEQTASRNWHTSFRKVKAGLPGVAFESLNRDDTTRLVETAREQDTTIFGAIAASLFLAAGALNPESPSRPVRMLAAVDLRQRLGLSDELVLAATAVPLVTMPGSAQSFWSLARQARQEIVAKTDDNAILLAAARSADNWTKYKTADELMTFYAQHLGFDILFTNLGRWPAIYESQSLQLKAVWGPAVLVGLEGEQGISAVTVNGELRLLHVSFDLEALLLQEAIKLLKTSITPASS